MGSAFRLPVRMRAAERGRVVQPGVCAPACTARVGDFVEALWPEDGSWYRARVEQVNGDGSLSVTYVEYPGPAVTVRVHVHARTPRPRPHPHRRARQVSLDMIRPATGDANPSPRPSGAAARWLLWHDRVVAHALHCCSRHPGWARHGLLTRRVRAALHHLLGLGGARAGLRVHREGINV
jgi:hypothetical protein